MTKRKTDSAPAAPGGKRFLRVHAEGGQNIHASDSKFSLDAKPDPYVVFVLENVTHKCDHVNDVEPLEYFSWPNAVKDFDITQERTLTDSSLAIHVKDSDTVKDRYIGGTSIPLGPLYAAMQKNVLCQSKMFTLEFADDKFKKKKDSGEVKLTITLIEEGRPPDQPAKETPSTPLPELVEAPPIVPQASSTLPQSSREVEQAEQSKTSEEPKNTSVLKPIVDKPPLQAESEKVQELKHQPHVVSPPAFDSMSKSSQDSTEGKTDVDSTHLSALARQPTKRRTVPIESSEKAAESAKSVTNPTPKSQTHQSTQDVASSVALGSTAPPVIKTMTIELVSARNLSRPASFGAVFDRKPDPLVALEFYGVKKSSIALKDVDLKKPVEWNQVMLSFDLPRSAMCSLPRKGASPMDLVIHVKDENLLKTTYMGGTKVSVEEFFLNRGPSGEWIGSPTAVSGTERTYPLDFGDENLLKRKQCGEIVVRFHFTLDAKPDELSPQPAAEASGRTDMYSTPTPVVSSPSSVNPDEPHSEVNPHPSEPVDSASVAAPSATPKLSSDVKMLSVEALCGRNLLRPSTGSNPKGLMKALFDRKPDPYVIFVLGEQQKKCPSLKDVDVAFFEWHNAVQVFDITQKPYPKELLVHVRDDDTVGKDPYMAGARIPLEKIWGVTAEPTGTDAEVVTVVPLTFIDEQLTKQKPCGEVTLRFRWIYAEAPLPVVEPLPPKADESPSMPAATSESPIEAESSAAQKAPVAKTYVGYVFLRNIALWNKGALIDSSLDLYVVASCFPPDAGRSAKGRISASTSVLTDATKGKGTTAEDKVEWKGEELVLPVVSFDGDGANDFMVELKDKNAITKDTQVAELLLSVGRLIAANGEQATDITLEVDLLRARKSKASTPTQSVPISIKFQFLPLGSPLLESSLSAGINMTVFLVKSVLRFTSDEEQQKHIQASIAYGVNLDYLSNQKKHGFLSFGKRDIETQTDPFHPKKDLSIEWRTCLDAVYSSKQVAAAKDKESLEVEVQLLQIPGKSAAKCVGSIQLDLWALLNNISSKSNQLINTQTIAFGENASMDLEFAVAYRSENAGDPVSQKSGKHGEVSLLKSAVHVPSGNLHLLVLKAQSLVSPDGKEERVEELDPEVRVSIEPKYIKRKENPVRSMLKTRPLENAGANPIWNEYLRLEYRLPPPAVDTSTIPVGKAIEANGTLSETTQMLSPPIIQVGIYDIEVVSAAQINMCYGHRSK